jgi:hypothetical protein
MTDEPELVIIQLSPEAVAPQLSAATGMVDELYKVSKFVDKMTPKEALAYGLAMGLTMMRHHHEQTGGKMEFEREPVPEQRRKH